MAVVIVDARTQAGETSASGGRFVVREDMDHIRKLLEQSHIAGTFLELTDSESDGKILVAVDYVVAVYGS
jgi:hypothetical protein